ncbi:cytidine deaminase [Ferrimonas senticii]|uniref:cytidine deaminase n=1 Tax=Ferrimonas senticii TaxID=394566 RepID=UPI0004135960|nr:cytidine deaminase [Ferrimonas senticii]
MDSRYIPVLAAMPAELASALTPLLQRPFAGIISAAERQLLEQQSGLSDKALLLALLPVAAARAYVPISGFYVGAIAVGQSGNLYFGANMELPNQTLFHSVHGEQSAISNAWLAGETALTDMVINASPCGHCRQFMNELATQGELRITLPENGTQGLSHYLPYAFGPKNLGINYGLMQAPKFALSLSSCNPLTQSAVEQAEQSYAPYSQSPAAVVLETAEGRQFAGRYAENAAFNPSLPPMQMALNAMMLAGVEFDQIDNAILVETEGAQISQAAASQTALASVSEVTLTIHNAKLA